MEKEIEDRIHTVIKAIKHDSFFYGRKVLDEYTKRIANIFIPNRCDACENYNLTENKGCPMRTTAFELTGELNQIIYGDEKIKKFFGKNDLPACTINIGTCSKFKRKS